MSRYDPVLMGQCCGLPVPYIAAGVNVALLSYFQVKGISGGGGGGTKKKTNKKTEKQQNTQGSPATCHVSFCVVYHKY